MTTNGYKLNGAAAEHLARLGVRAYQVSLDGPAAHHDQTRVRADGRGSFEQLWRNLLSIRESTADVRILLRLHLTPANLPAMPDFVTLLRSTFLCDPRFSVFLKRVVQLGGRNDPSMDVVDPADERVAALEAILCESGKTQQMFEPERVCYAARGNSLMVRADGRLGKCTVALSHPANNIGHLLPDGSLRIDNPRLRPWFKGWELRESDLTSCPYQTFTTEQPSMLQIGNGSPAALAHS